MYRLMLLDDEEIVIKSIQKVFRLEEFGFEVVGAFSNPAKALAQIEDLKPDLIITDVKMPQMDGLEFSGRVLKKLPDAEIVILSGYDDFSYAQTAVKLGISDYLLKPIKKDDFKNMLLRMYKKIDEKLTERNYYQSLQSFAETNYTELKNRFFLELAENGILDENYYRVLRQNHGLDLSREVFMLIKADIYQIGVCRDYMSEMGKITQQMGEELAAYGNVEDFLSDESLYFFLYKMDAEVSEDVRASVLAFADAKRQEGMQLSVGVSGVYRGLEKVFAARNDCIRQILMSEVDIDVNSEENPVRRQEINLNIPYTEIENLFRAISTADTSKIREAVEKIYEMPGSAVHSLYRDYSFSITFLILLRMYQLQNKYDAAQGIVPRELLQMRTLKNRYTAADRQKELVEHAALLLSELIEKQEVAAPSKTILAALDYINAHFCENISLSDVADNICISKNYLCDIFKKELGVTFINYVTNLRIEKAKEYLSTTDLRMYEVSDAVGYNDYAYFSQIFKKHTGTTLSAYRRRN